MIYSLNRLLRNIPIWNRVARSSRLRSLLGFEETLWTRKVSDEQVRRLVKTLKPSGISALEISGTTWQSFGFRAYRSVEYPDFDISRDVLTGSFDLIIAEHIFEHLLRPYNAGQNVLKMLRPGGHFLVVTPFIYKVHLDPFDCTRWTETGIKYFLAECGFPLELITTGSWGNYKCIKATFRQEYRLFNRYIHTLKNEPDLPIVVWAFAQKRCDCALLQ